MVTIDGLSVPEFCPADVDELATRVADCFRSRTAIYPEGGGNGLDFGAAPTQAGLAIGLAHLNRIIDYPARDLTITAEAGVTMDQLRACLAAEHQRFPIDVPCPASATLGGAISVAAAGSRRLAYGTWRDHILGVSVVNDRGDVCTSGGRVVKNVAGYDLGKLYAGSLGSLAIITQVTLKLQPVPAQCVWLRGAFRLHDLPSILDQLHASPTRPAAVDVVKSSGLELFILFEGNAEAVRWQCDTLRAQSKIPFDIASPDIGESVARYETIENCETALIAGVPPSRVAEFVQGIDRDGLRWHAHALSGVIRLGLAETDFEGFAAVQATALSKASELNGNVVVRRCPPAWKRGVSVWGRPPASLRLMKSVKREFDPTGILNPGRTAVDCFP